MFNAMRGKERRMLFHDADHGRQVDVFVGSFRMCHEIQFGDGLDDAPELTEEMDLENAGHSVKPAHARRGRAGRTRHTGPARLCAAGTPRRRIGGAAD